jgi:hypothetical protein
MKNCFSCIFSGSTRHRKDPGSPFADPAVKFKKYDLEKVSKRMYGERQSTTRGGGFKSISFQKHLCTKTHFHNHESAGENFQ